MIMRLASYAENFTILNNFARVRDAIKCTIEHIAAILALYATVCTRVVAVVITATDVYCAVTLTNPGSDVHVRDVFSGMQAITARMKKNGRCTPSMHSGPD